MKKDKFFSAGYIILCLLFVSCVSGIDNSMILSNIYMNDYEAALNSLEQEKEYLYTETDTVLYNLDSGILAHYSKNWTVSNTNFSEAEKLIEYYYSKSITQNVASFFSNDTVIDYSGEEYEDIYTNIFMALNYIQLGKTEDAFVEIRRFDNKLKALSVKYADELAYADKELSSRKYNHAGVTFNNSAFARYLSMLLYRASGKTDSANVDYKLLKKAYETQINLYPFKMPSTIEEELSVPRDLARINVIGFAGLAPSKEEEVVRINSGDGDLYYKIAYPVMYKRGSRVGSIEVTLSDADGVESSMELELLESIENIAVDTFSQHQAVIYSKALIRSIAKSAASSTLNFISDNSNDRSTAALFQVLALASQVGTELTERADVRTSQYFPAKVYAGGITVKPGVYSVSVVYRNKSGDVLKKDNFDNFNASAGKINLLESLCLR